MSAFQESVNKLLCDKNINNILFLENGSMDESHRIERLFHELNKPPYKVTFIEHASHNVNKVLESLKTAEIIIAETSFIRADDVLALLEIIQNNPSLIIALSVRGNLYDLDCFLKNLYPKQLHVLDKHDIYVSTTEDKENNELKLFNLKKYIPQKPELKDFSVASDEYNVIVKRVIAQGEEFNAVKIGINQQYYNYNHPNGYYGAWVAGKTEPVLLINFDGALEWEYEKFDTIDKILHYIASCSPIKKDNEKWIVILNTMKQWVLSAPRETRKEITTIVDKFDDLIDSLNIPRRGYRSRIRQIVHEYIESHRYFNEQDRGIELHSIIR